MGDCLATTDMGRKRRRATESPSNTIWPGLRPTSVPSGILTIQLFGHNRHGLKIGELGPHLTQCRLGWGLPPYQVASWSIQPFRHNGHGPKIGGTAVPLWRARSLSNTAWPGLRPTSIPSGILIHRAIWPQQTWAKNWGLCPFFGGSWVPI